MTPEHTCPDCGELTDHTSCLSTEGADAREWAAYEADLAAEPTVVFTAADLDRLAKEQAYMGGEDDETIPW